MKLLEEHRGDFWPDFIAVTLMAGASGVRWAYGCEHLAFAEALFERHD